jgi:hypothetical protein
MRSRTIPIETSAGEPSWMVRVAELLATGVSIVGAAKVVEEVVGGAKTPAFA